MGESFLELDALTAISPIDGRYSGKCGGTGSESNGIGYKEYRLCMEWYDTY